MQTVRVNTLSYVSRDKVSQDWSVDGVFRAFLAVKHASLAMMKANPERGKPYGGGSIVLVASGECLLCPPRMLPFLMVWLRSAAGIRSGAGPLHCKRLALFITHELTRSTDSASKAA
jgi:hypothetical protein